MPSFFTSIRFRLAARLVILTSAVLLAAGGALILLIEALDQRQFDRVLEARARASLRSILDESRPAAAQLAGADPDFFFQAWRASGEILVRSPSLGVAAQLVRSPADSEARYRNVDLPDGRCGRQTQIESTRIDPEAPRIVAVAALARAGIDARAASFRRSLAIVLSLFILAIGGLAHIVVDRGLRPLATLTNEIGRLDHGDLSHRLSIDPSAAGLRSWIDRINRLLDDVEKAIVRERRTTGDIAHELRTPVAELRNLAEVGRRWPEDRETVEGFFDDVREIARQMEATIADLEILARSESGLEPVEIRPVAVAEVIDRVWPAIAEHAHRRRLEVQLEAAPELIADTDPDKLQLILLNLLTNAVTYSRPGGFVALAARRDGDRLRVTVANPPRDLKPTDLERMFDRFWRKDASRSGQNAGLGLALVRALAELLKIEIESRLEEGVLSISLLIAESPVP